MHKPLVRTTPIPRLTPEPFRPCRVDPQIRSITLTKVGGMKNKIQVSFDVYNNGSTAWRSGANQQNVTLCVRNGSTGAVYTVTRALPAGAPAGGRMLTFTTPVIPNAFDTFEFSGTVDVQISYDPDIAIDGNKCNDDTNSANNRREISARMVQAFLGETRSSRTY
ncbi:hypothetical protein [Sphingomonas sp. LT1P40]|uniref:hypothetical protein n=1 Tax=Alteristakelama amylovorans TaxID=3096166 RepID=UPI002FC7B531